MKNFFRFLANIFKMIKIAITNSSKYELVNEAINGNSFDFAYLYYIEKQKLIEMREYFKIHGISTRNDEIIKQIDFAIKLLNIIIDENVYHFEYYTDNEGNDYSSDIIYVCDVKVNLKNIDRFTNNNLEKDIIKNKFPHELYLMKARNLYHKLRYYYEENWWD